MLLEFKGYIAKTLRKKKNKKMKSIDLEDSTKYKKYLSVYIFIFPCGYYFSC